MDNVTLSDFFSFVLPGQGYYYILRTQPDGRSRHRVASTQDELLVNAHGAKTASENGTLKNAYFCPATFTKGYTKAEDGRSKANRKQEHAHSCKSLFVDLDCGDGKPFTDKRQALYDLQSFVNKTGFPSPNVIVNTGGGWHIYWVLDTEVPAAEWSVLAETFKSFCLSKGFRIDPSVTGDIARPMRLPYSTNNKYSPPLVSDIAVFQNNRPISVSEIKKLLSVQAHVAPKLAHMFGDLRCELSTGKSSSYGPKYAKYIVEKCPLLADIAATAGRNCNEPLWKATLQLLRYTEDGAEWVHKVSSGHEGYSQASCDRKFAERLQYDVGPTTCSEFSNHAYTDYCTQCEYKITSPIVLGIEPEKVPDIFPAGYELRSDGIWTAVDGKPKRVIRTKVYNLTVTESQQGAEGVVTTLDFNIMLDKEKHILVTGAQLSDNKAAFKATVDQGLTLHDEGESKAFRGFMMAWVDELRKAGRVSRSAGQFGWTFDSSGKPKGFVVGRDMFHPDGSASTAGRTRDSITEYYSPTGTPEGWQVAADLLVSQDVPELMVIVASAFAAPLLRFTGVSGAILASVSKHSGVGKSSAMKVAQGVWGHPVKGINALSDTSNSVVRRMSVLNNLPAYWDEIRLKDDVEAFVKLAFQLGQGKEKARLNQDASMRDVNDWKTMLICASNTSMINNLDSAEIDSNAGVLRIMEYYIDNIVLSGTDVVQASEIFSNIDMSYGHAGHIYARWLITNHDKAKSIVKHILSKLNSKLNINRDERFWAATAATLLAGATIAKYLKIVDFNMQTLERFVVALFLDMRALHENDLHHVDECESVIAEFIREKADTSVVTNRIPSGRGRPKPIHIQHSPERGRQITHHIATDTGVVRIPQKLFREWLGNVKKRNVLDVIRGIRNRGFMVNDSKFGTIGGGTPYCTGVQERCYEFSIRHLRAVTIASSGSSHDHDSSSETAQKDST